jgi:hypothetical protein
MATDCSKSLAAPAGSVIAEGVVGASEGCGLADLPALSISPSVNRLAMDRDRMMQQGNAAVRFCVLWWKDRILRLA